MQIPLNLPILSQLADSQNILIAGAGGGFDVFVGLPIYYELREMGKTVHLANYTFADTLSMTRHSDSVVLLDQLLVGTRGKLQLPLGYAPEAYLADWFNRGAGEETTIWLIEKVGVPGVVTAYSELVDHLNIDAIILVDGGVDSIMRGNEEGAGTFLEDTIVITAVAELKQVPVRILAAIGMGAEHEEMVCHYNALENIAALTKAGGFYGSCALIPQMAAFAFYRMAAEYVFTETENEASRIQSRLIPSVLGEFGSYNWLNHPRQPDDVFHSPLMSLYWFFDAVKVSEHSYAADIIRGQVSFRRAVAALMTTDKLQVTRPRRKLPL